MDKFLKELMDLITVEANNGDYYLDGYVPGYRLDELINKYFPEYQFTSEYTYCRWYPRPKSNLPGVGIIQDIYNQQIIDQLNIEKGFALFKTINPKDFNG